MPWCCKCGENKPREEFYPSPYIQGGLMVKCKKCADIDAKKFAAKTMKKTVNKKRVIDW